jgi:hypothetical protein
MVDDCEMGSVEGMVRRSGALSGRLLRRVGRRSDGRAPLWIELAIIGWLFWLYDVVNDFAPIRQLLAIRNAGGLLSAERSVGLDPELALNHWLAGHHTLGIASSYYYFFAHGVVTFTVLALLWWKRPPLYLRLRTQLVIINLIAFVVFWRYPLAPPRMFPRLGYIDVVAVSHAFVSWSSGALVHDADQLAAMPSLHVAWAIWSGIAVWQLFRTRLSAVFAVKRCWPWLVAAASPTVRRRRPSAPASRGLCWARARARRALPDSCRSARRAPQTASGPVKRVATSVRIWRIAAAAAVSRVPAGVAAITSRTGLRGESARMAMSSRAPANASFGIRATPTPAATRP